MKEPTVDSVMTKEVVTARPETTFKELVTLMNEHRVSGLPVVDAKGRPLGVVSEADTLVKQEQHGGAASRPWLGRGRRARWRKATGRVAGDLMTTPAVTIGPDETVTAAARTMAHKNVRRLCVVDSEGKLVGVVARRDVIGTFLRDDDAIRADIEEYVFKKGMWLFPGVSPSRSPRGWRRWTARWSAGRPRWSWDSSPTPSQASSVCATTSASRWTTPSRARCDPHGTVTEVPGREDLPLCECPARRRSLKVWKPVERRTG